MEKGHVSQQPSVGLWSLIALASLILMITMGVRQTVGLFVHPIVHSTTLSIAEVSMALAIGQLMWGAFQPLFGAWADKRGAFNVLVIGAILMALGQLSTLWASSFLPLTLAQGLLSPAGAAAGSFSVLIGIVAGRLPSDKGSVASGMINAGGSADTTHYQPAWFRLGVGFPGPRRTVDNNSIMVSVPEKRKTLPHAGSTCVIR